VRSSPRVSGQARRPFREVSVVTQKDAEELKNISGRNDLPTLVVGTRVHVGFQEGAYNGMLEDAGYPSSVAPLPIEALRKMDSEAKAPTQRDEGAPGTAGSDAAGR